MRPASLDLASAQEASSRLGVSRASLYAYVSRGLIRSFSSPHDPRQRLYAVDDVEALVKRRTRFRRPAAAAATALDWGLPVLETSLTQIKDGLLFYRGVDAVALSEAASLEETARLLIGELDWGASALPGSLAGVGKSPALGAHALGPHYLGLHAFVAEAIRLLSERDCEDSHQPAIEIGSILRAMAAAGSGQDPGHMPIHRHLALAWGVCDEAGDAIRRALVLCADHELSASAFAVRVAASTGATLRNAMIAGLATLSGPLHGGATEHVRAYLERRETDRGSMRVAESPSPPGFHHQLYPDGDPRGIALLERARPRASDASVAREIERATGARPNIDAALVMMERGFDLPRGAAFALFAIGRTAGWLAHAVEQRGQASLIRPRARYTVAETGSSS
jgi:citrate synthase